MPENKTKKTNQKGIVIVIAGPTGSGETSVSREVAKKLPNTEMTITATSRKPRPGEKHGKDYYFIPKEEFKKKIKQGYFLEYIKIMNRDMYYGTIRKDIEKKLDKGINVIANLEWQGAKIMKQTYKNTLTVFLKPDKISRIKKRLINRDPNISKEEFEKRLQNAKDELKEAKYYNYVVINYEGKMNQTVRKIIKIIKNHLKSINSNI